MPTPTLPNFFLVGAPKAGTTSLYHYLDQHPQIYMSPIKEPHYFADEIRIENFTAEMRRMAEPRLPALRAYLQGPVNTKFSGGPISEWPDYLKLFQSANGQPAIGEASVCYLWSKTAPHNIAARFPDARILMVLRNPVDRAFSQYLHVQSLATRRVEFQQYMEANLRSTKDRIGEGYPFLEFGLYHEQVRRYFSLFPRRQIQIYFYEDYCRDPLAVVRDIFRFLSVDPAFIPDFSQRHTEPRVPRSYAANRWLKRAGLWDRARKFTPAPLRRRLRRLAFQPRDRMSLDPASRSRLVDFYRDDVRNLSALLNRDLSSWLTPS